MTATRVLVGHASAAGSTAGIAERIAVTLREAGVEAITRDFRAGFTPRAHRLFAGIVDMTGLPVWGRTFWRLIGGRPGDQRDWPAVDAWARQIAAELSTVRSH